MRIKVEKMTSDFDHDWNDISVFEKLPVRRVSTGRYKHRERRMYERKAARRQKMKMQEKNYA